MDPIAATTALVALGSGVVGLVVARRWLLARARRALALTCLRAPAPCSPRRREGASTPSAWWPPW
ncbi:MAG: hypothetical protein R2749_19910 [Acidimicrobiales bacterium]